MLQTIRDWAVTLASAKYLGVGSFIKNLIISLLIGLLGLLILIIGLIFAAIPAAIVIGLLFLFAYPYAIAYGKMPLPVSLILLLSSGTILVYKIIELSGAGRLDYTLAASLAVFYFSLFSFPFKYRPPAADRYNAWRFVFVTLYSVFVMIFSVLPLGEVTGIIPLHEHTGKPKAFDIEEYNNVKGGSSGFSRWNSSSIDTCWLWFFSALYLVGGISLNKLFFERFQWRHLKEYEEFKNKYGIVINKEDKKRFEVKLNNRFGDKWKLKDLEDAVYDENNSWSDSIMFSYLVDHWGNKN